ncbi:DUF423 domain-containing protein [Listeria fleischmannii]|uniref:DUF423 domain-containing protein n=1 Tax=Listeria fleischmannii TaxID=1069827 RepID=A0A841YE23_9LIST|nr:DUF423 domain-containing protein [Listeria fleischmannii]EIA20960.1 hypothetical protein KKC_04144 [Listeria fleischmannii subsp. coloradonensis]MBC1398387.1 DUF423 domain-containing protein [Listeria fleischmannii]MBC1426448.1 DUF423 domain-containing protein [Listeria fleischmannii]STY35720.1 Protein of uncharacterised function (DUF423) [Listeria fleischmannii subsp. coloradonensis]
MKKGLIIGGIFAMLAVAIGAFGAHALKDILGSYRATYETGVQYQMFHAVAILVCALAYEKLNSRLVGAAIILFSAGIILFSGSLYILSITKITVLGAITPIGGVCFIAAWICFIIAAAKSRPTFRSF